MIHSSYCIIINFLIKIQHLKSYSFFDPTYFMILGIELMCSNCDMQIPSDLVCYIYIIIMKVKVNIFFPKLVFKIKNITAKVIHGFPRLVLLA